MNEQRDLTGYTQAEIAHMERVEQQGLLHEEICWLGDQGKGQDVKDVALAALERLQWLNQQVTALVQRAAYWEARAAGAEAIVEHQVIERDKILDDYSEYIRAVQDGTHRDVKALVEETHQAAFDQFQQNAERLMDMAQKLRGAGD